MKKLISVMLVAVMVLSLGAVAFASEEGLSVGAGAAIEVEKAEGANGEAVNLVVEKPQSAPTAAQEAAAETAATEKVGEDAYLSEAFEIRVEGDPDAKNVTVTFVYDGDGEVAGVLYWNETTNGWDYAAATKVGDSYQVTFEHFCTAYFVLKAEAASSGGNTTSSGKTSSTSKGVTSPKTGWD